MKEQCCQAMEEQEVPGRGAEALNITCATDSGTVTVTEIVAMNNVLAGGSA